MGKVNLVWFLLLVVLSSAFTSRSEEEEEEDYCVYTMYIRTGSALNAGTNSKIGTTLFDAEGSAVSIDDLVEWGGLMGPKYNYFERRNLDIFSGKAQCLLGPVCAMNLTSDGSGLNPGWYCNYVEVTSTGVHIPPTQRLFTVEQWLALDSKPYQLFAYLNNCSSLGNANNINPHAHAHAHAHLNSLHPPPYLRSLSHLRLP